MSAFRDRLYISTMAEDAPALAAACGLGLEIAEFCTAYNMDMNFPDTNAKVLSAMQSASRFTFHAPFSELCPAAIDPLVRDVAKKRFVQAIRLAHSYGITKIIIHGGFIPQVYFPEWFVPQSVEFWRGFLSETDDDTLICLENVMEPSPDLLTAVVEEIDDPRLRLCLDIGHARTRPQPLPVEEWIDKEAPFLSHVHIHNNNGVHDLHDPLGCGVLDAAKLIDRIEGLGSDVTYAIENMNASASVNWLQKHDYI